jgi:MoxR-like ATPase
MDNDWKIFTGKLEPHDGIKRLPPPPPWRDFDGEVMKGRKLNSKSGEAGAPSFTARTRGQTFQFDVDDKDGVIAMVNAALYLRRPLLITGKPGTGKSSLVHAVAHELKLGDALEWPINSRSALQHGLYEYDAVGRLRGVQLGEGDKIEKYLRLGPLGSAFIPSERPRALLIDEIDKSDLDLPNDLLNIFEQGHFTIPELKRLGGTREIEDHTGKWAFKIADGQVRCHAFPFVVMTSNGEREFPLPFLRRCLSLKMADPDVEVLKKIVRAHLREEISAEAEVRIVKFDERLRNRENLATDQLLNAVFLLKGLGKADQKERDKLVNAILKSLDV